MFPLLRPPVGTETEINPTRQPSQKPGIRFPLKVRKRPQCRACQTTVAHTLHRATNTATPPRTRIPLQAHSSHADFTREHMQATHVHANMLRFATCAYLPHTHMHTFTHVQRYSVHMPVYTHTLSHIQSGSQTQPSLRPW
jgi:hypothetical protein